MRRKFFLFAILVHMCGAAVDEAAAGEIIKFGTLATEASVWGKAFNRMNVELIERTDGELRYQFHWGRDEKDLVDLMKNRQLDAASLTSVGLTRVLPAAAIFQLPMLFSTYEELDYVKENLTARFTRQFEESGYVFLGWGELGFIYLFSKDRIKTRTDLQKTRVWVRTIDPIAKAFAAAAGQEPVLLPFENVLLSLTEDEVQTVYTSPLACLAFQWQTQVKYMTDLRLAAGLGATLIDEGRFDALSREQRDLLLEITDKYHRQLKSTVRASNRESIDVLQDQGIGVVSVLPREKQKWSQMAKRVQNQFVGQLYERDLLEEVRRLIEQHHAQQDR